MIMLTVIGVVISAVCAIVGFVAPLRFNDSDWWYGLLFVGAVSVGTGNLPFGYLAYGQALLIAWIWWNRRKRRRAAKLASERGRMIIARMVATLRQRAKPRAALRPIPQGTVGVQCP